MTVRLFEMYAKAIDGKCDFKCPVGYVEDPHNLNNCYYCGESCPKGMSGFGLWYWSLTSVPRSLHEPSSFECCLGSSSQRLYNHQRKS